MRTKWISILFLPLSCLGATSYQDLASVRMMVQTQVSQAITPPPYSRLELDIKGPDERLKLAECPANSLRVILPHAQAPQTISVVNVKCESASTSWGILIPISVKFYAPVLSTKTGLEKGKLLSSSDLITTEQDISQLRGNALTDPQKLIGLSLTHPVPANHVLRESDVVQPILIHKGDDVTLKDSHTDFSVSITGKALQDARYGEHIKVEVGNTHRVITGIASNSRLVTVNPTS